MARGEGWVPRLELLFGGVWQAALDHAGMVSRRRARDIGAGEEPSGALIATLELLERLPVAEWPERWGARQVPIGLWRGATKGGRADERAVQCAEMGAEIFVGAQPFPARAPLRLFTVPNQSLVLKVYKEFDEASR